MRPIEQIIAAIEHGRRTRHTAKLTPEEKAFAVEHRLMQGKRKKANRTHDEIVRAIEHARKIKTGAGLTPEERAYAKAAGLFATRWSPAKPTYRRPERVVPLTDAQRALVEESVEWVRLLAGKRHRKAANHVEFDDVFQAAFVSVCLSAQKFDPKAGATFKTFASARANFAITDFYRENTWGFRRGDADAPVRYTLRSLDAPLGGADTPPEIPIPSFHHDLEAVVALEQFAARFYPIAGKVVRGLADGKPMHRIAAENGIPGGSAWSALQRFREFFGEEIREVLSA